MSGVKLMEMEASDMVDVLHFLFEEDFTAVSEDHSLSRSAVRDVLYNEMYGVPYTFKIKPRKTSVTAGRASAPMSASSTSDLDSLDSVEPFNPRENINRPDQPLKPFVPATDFDPNAAKPFEGLDAPLGG